MPCEIHNWWFDSACPKCAVAAVAPVTVPVTKGPEPEPKEPEVEIPARNFPDTQAVRTPAASGETDPENIGSNENLTGETPAVVDETPPIPDFLLRNPDNTFMHPAPWGPLTPLIAKSAPETEDPKTLSDNVLAKRLYDQTLSVADRQKYIMEATARENKRKAYERLDKMKEAKQNKGTTDPTE